jgi:hypothetical protein
LVYKIIAILLAGLAPMPCGAEFRDPTQPAYLLPTTAVDNTASSNSELVLSAIWISSQSRRAIINGVSAKQGQTIDVTPISSLIPKQTTPTNTATADNKAIESALSLSNGHTNSGTSQENILTSLLSAVTENAPQKEQSAINTANKGDAIHPKTANIPSQSTTIKIISILKNSVIIDQNGELKTLQLVKRPYKTQQITSKH